MIFSISNILWSRKLNDLPSFCKHLKGNGISALELALSCYVKDPFNIDNELTFIKKTVNSFGVKICSLHSLTYNRPELEIFADEEQMNKTIDYILAYDEICGFLDCNHMTFGSPKARNSNLSTEDTSKRFEKFLKLLDSRLNYSDLGIEPLPPKYCNFLNTYEEAFSYSEKYKKIKIQLDLKSIRSDNINYSRLKEMKSEFAHCQVSADDFSIPKIEQGYHKDFLNFLREINYQGYVSLEAIKENNDITSNEIKAFKSIYGDLL